MFPKEQIRTLPRKYSFEFIRRKWEIIFIG